MAQGRDSMAGIHIGTQAKSGHGDPKTKDHNPDNWFWRVYDEILAVCKIKSENVKWDKQYIAWHIAAEHSLSVTKVPSSTLQV